jgi:hypothetical protein
MGVQAGRGREQENTGSTKEIPEVRQVNYYGVSSGLLTFFWRFDRSPHHYKRAITHCTGGIRYGTTSNTPGAK